MAEIRDVVAELVNVPVGTLHSDTEFRGLPGWDSLAMLSLIVMYEDEFGLSISNEQLKQARTIADLEMLARTQ